MPRELEGDYHLHSPNLFIPVSIIRLDTFFIDSY